MAFTGAADRVDASGGFGQGETRPQAFTGLDGKGYLIGRTQDRIIEIADISDPDTSTYVSAVIGNPNSMASHNGSLYVFIGRDLIRFDTPFSDTDTGTDIFTINETPRALTSDGTNLYYIHQNSTLNFLYRIDDLDGTPTAVSLGRVGSSANIRGFVWHDGFFWGVDATTDRLVKIILTTDSNDPHTVENVGSFSQFVGPLTNPQGFGVVNGVGYVSALDNDGSLWELRDFKFTDTIADQSWTVGTAVSVDAPATEDGATPITYAISPALPAGVTLDTSTGEISGDPTAETAQADYTLTATDDNSIEATLTFSASVAASGGSLSTPTAPRNLTATPQSNGTSVVLDWDVPSDNGGASISDYEYSDDDGSTFTAIGSTDTDVTVTGLEKNTEYDFRVRAVNSEGSGTATATVTATTDSTVPNAPTGLSVTVGETIADLSWTAPSDTGGEAITSYEVSSDDGSTWIDTGDTDLTYQITGLTANTEYDFKVRAINAEGSGTASSTVTETTDAAVSALSFGSQTIANQSWTVGNSVNITLPQATGGTGTITYTLTPTLPAGTTFTATTRALAGNPTAVFSVATFTYTAEDEDGNTVELTFTLAVAVAPPSLHNTFIFRDCVNYRNNGGRVAEHGNASNIIRAVADNDRETFSTETDYAVDIAVDSAPTRVDAFYLVSKGVDTHAGTPTGGTGTGWTARTVPASVDNIRGESVSTVVDGLQYDLFLLDTHFTAESVRLQFTGTGIEIYEVMLLEIVQEINATYSDFLGYAAEQVNRTGRVERSPIGAVSVVDSTREKRDVEMTVHIRPSGRTLIQSPDEFLYLLEANPRLTLAEGFSENPSFLYPSIVGSLEIPAPYHSSYKPLGYDMTILIRER